MDAKLKHLEMVQAVINRMAGNSFQLKGWSVTLVAALFALSSKDSNVFFAWLAYFPCVMFWGLDGYFLWQERMYRQLYEAVTTLPPDAITFDLNAAKFQNTVGSWPSVCISVTLAAFHGIIFGVISIIMAVSLLTGSK